MSPSASWSRYGSQYRRLCARAGCGAPAVTTLRFQSTERQAWLVELDDNAARTQGDLCQRHASALVLPRGWELHDERTSATPEAEPGNGVKSDAVKSDPVNRGTAKTGNGNGNGKSSGNGNGSRRVRVRRKESAEPEAGADQLPGLEPAAAIAGDGAGPRSMLVPFGAADDDEIDDALEAILDARTPLLQRAFRNAKPSN